MILRIGGKKIDFFNEFTLTLNFNSAASSFGFKWYFDPNNEEHVKMGRPNSYQSVVVEHKDEVLITGKVLSHTYTDESKKSLAALSGYSTPGVLADCMDASAPLQSDGLTLREIAKQITDLFGIYLAVDKAVDAEMDQVIESTTSGEKQNYAEYLDQLATQAGVVMSHTPKGSLRFTRPLTDRAPIAHFDRGQPATKMTLSVNGQSMHSVITVVMQAGEEAENAGEASVRNPYVSGYRPRTVVQSSGDDTTSATVARAALGEELKNISLTIEVDDWKLSDKLITPNHIITVTNSELFLHKKTRWFIESVTYTGDHTKTTAVIKCCLPAVYETTTPTNVFS